MLIFCILLPRAGKCWLRKERRRRYALKAKESPNPAYERPGLRRPRTREAGERFHAPPNASGVGNGSTVSERLRTSAFGGRLAPTVSVGGLPNHQASGVPARGGRNRCLYDPDDVVDGTRNDFRAGLGLSREAAGEYLVRDGHDTPEELLEHDYGDSGRVEVGFSDVVLIVCSVGAWVCSD